MDGEKKIRREGCQQSVSGFDELMAELTQQWEYAASPLLILLSLSLFPSIYLYYLSITCQTQFSCQGQRGRDATEKESWGITVQFFKLIR